VAVRAVIFDWAGTLTPWHAVDLDALWRQVCGLHFPPDQAASVAAAILAAEAGLWDQGETGHHSATLDNLFAMADVTPDEDLLETYFGLWEPHTYTDPDVAPLLRSLRERSIRVGVLSNTVWPRALHERVCPVGRGPGGEPEGGVLQKNREKLLAVGRFPPHSCVGRERRAVALPRGGGRRSGDLAGPNGGSGTRAGVEGASARAC
jgi:hypothetical protein